MVYRDKTPVNGMVVYNDTGIDMTVYRNDVEKWDGV